MDFSQQRLQLQAAWIVKKLKQLLWAVETFIGNILSSLYVFLYVSQNLFWLFLSDWFSQAEFVFYEMHWTTKACSFDSQRKASVHFGGVVCPVVPLFDFLEKSGTRTLCWYQLSMGINFIIWCQFVELNAFQHQQKSSLNLLFIRKHFVERSDVCNANATRVVSCGELG